MAIKKVLWYNAPQTINENFEDVNDRLEIVEAVAIDPAAAITTFSGVPNLPVVPTLADTAAVKTYLDSLYTPLEARLDAIESKINLIITALRSSGVILT